MLSAIAYEFAWKSVLVGLATRNRDVRLALQRTPDENPPETAEPAPAEQADDDADAFHLDDTEMASRLTAGRLKPTMAGTPPHAHLMFPMLGRLVR